MTTPYCQAVVIDGYHTCPYNGKVKQKWTGMRAQVADWPGAATSLEDWA